MDKEKKRAFPTIRNLMALALWAATLTFVPAGATEITEAQVFEWWDDGIIEAEEANEMLSLIDEGNMQEVCALAEIYANEPCGTDSQAFDGEDELAGDRIAGTKSTGRKRAPKAQKKYSGHIASKVRFDSTGSVSAQRSELRFNFHRLSLRLGSQELLTYKGKRGVAHLGQVSTRELHSEIPIDTLWGTVLSYTLGLFGITGLLDTSGTTGAQLTANTPFKSGPLAGMAAKVAYWNTDSSHSASIALSFPSGHIAVWHQDGMPIPLIHFRLHGRDSASISWRTTGYIHGKDLPQPARLSASIAKRRLWTTQNVTYRARGAFDTRVSASARILSPLNSDSISGRLTLGIESGPLSLRASAKITCNEASENCRQTTHQGMVGSSHGFGHLTATLSCSARTQYDREDASWKRPRIEFGTAITEKHPGRHENAFKVALVTPDAHPHKNIQVQSETRLTGDFLEFTLIATFKNTGGGQIRPSHAQISTRILF